MAKILLQSEPPQAQPRASAQPLRRAKCTAPSRRTVPGQRDFRTRGGQKSKMPGRFDGSLF
jgi:hypothetical protein